MSDALPQDIELTASKRILAARKAIIAKQRAIAEEAAAKEEAERKEEQALWDKLWAELPGLVGDEFVQFVTPKELPKDGIDSLRNWCFSLNLPKCRSIWFGVTEENQYSKRGDRRVSFVRGRWKVFRAERLTQGSDGEWYVNGTDIIFPDLDVAIGHASLEGDNWDRLNEEAVKRNAAREEAAKKRAEEAKTNPPKATGDVLLEVFNEYIAEQIAAEQGE